MPREIRFRIELLNTLKSRDRAYYVDCARRRFSLQVASKSNGIGHLLLKFVAVQSWIRCTTSWYPRGIYAICKSLFRLGIIRGRWMILYISIRRVFCSNFTSVVVLKQCAQICVAQRLPELNRTIECEWALKNRWTIECEWALKHRWG